MHWLAVCQKLILIQNKSNRGTPVCSLIRRRGFCRLWHEIKGLMRYLLQVQLNSGKVKHIVLCGCKLHMWWLKDGNSFTETVQVAHWRLAVCGALCRGNSCDSWPSESNGEGKRNKRTFTKAPANVNSLLTPLARSSQVLTFEKKSSWFKSVTSIYQQLFVVWLLTVANCCPVSREDSSQSLTSCLNLLPSPMDPTGDRIPGKDSSQRYARG